MVRSRNKGRTSVLDAPAVPERAAAELNVETETGAHLQKELETGDEVTYDAFISYSRAADGKLAPALQYGLHKFAKPWYKLRALRVFRDEASLSANPGLWPSIEAALSVSRYFVLLASQQSARSVWVKRELEYWCQHKDPNHLLIVITDEEPSGGDSLEPSRIVWDAEAHDFDWEKTNVLPADPLRGMFRDEPRYIRLGWARNAQQLSLRDPLFRSSVAEIAAPLHNRPKDELIGEDVLQHKRVVWLTRCTVAFLIVLVVLAATSAVIAIRQRDNARVQAAIAEAREFAARADSSKDMGTALALAVEAELRTPVAVPEARAAFARATQRAANTIALPHVSFRTEKVVKSVTWSPDGTRLAYASYERVQIRDARNGDPVGDDLKGHYGSIESVAWSPDGTLLASGGDDGTVQLWDVRTRKPIGVPMQHDAGVVPWVKSVSWSPDGTRLASSGANMTIRLWDSHTGKQLAALLQGPTGVISTNGGHGQGIAWSPDGTQLAIGSYDKTVRLWDARTGKQLGTLQGHTSPVWSVAWSPDGTRLASSDYDGTIRLWDARTGKQLGIPFLGHTSPVWSVAWSPDGSRLASSGNDGIRLWDGTTGNSLGPNLFRSGDSEIGAVVWSPDGTRLAVPVISGIDPAFVSREIHMIRIWKVTGRGLVDNSLQGHTSDVLSVAWSPDGSRLASSSSDGTVRLWDPDTGKPLVDFLQHQEVEGVGCLAWSPDGRRLATTSGDGIRVWTVAPGVMAGKPWWRTGGMNVVAWSPDGTLLAGGSDNGTVQLWDAATGKLSGEPLRVASSVVTSKSVGSIAWSPDGSLLATGDNDGSLQVWNAKTGKPTGAPLRGHDDALLSLAWSPDGARLASGSRDGSVSLWDIAGHKLVVEPLRGDDGTVLTVAWSPDGTRLASGGSSGTARLWDPNSGVVIGDISGAHRSGVMSLSWSPDGKRIATAGSDKMIRIWSAITERDACREAGQALGKALTSVLGDGRAPSACTNPESVKTLPPLPVLPTTFTANR